MGSEEGETTCIDTTSSGFEEAGKENGRRSGAVNVGGYYYILLFVFIHYGCKYIYSL